MSDKKFASQADLEEKKISFDKLSDHAYAYTAEGDPNTGIVVGDDAVMVIDTPATPRATPSSGCLRNGYSSPAIWWNTAPRPTPATRISPTGRRRSMRSPTSSR